MRKIIIYIVLLLLIGTGQEVISVNASSVTTSIGGSSTISVGQTFTLSFNASSTETIRTFTARVVYDKNLLSLVSSNPLGGAVFNSSTGAISSTAVFKGNHQFLTLTFKATTAFTAGSNTTVQLSNFEGANDTGTAILKSSSSLKISVAVPKSTNNDLSALTVNGSSVSGFSAATTTYNLPATNLTSIAIGATAADSKAKVTGTGTKNLTYGANSFRISVTSESGAVKNYTINITRNDSRSTNNYLSNLTVSSGTLAFNKTTNSYTVIVENDVTSITLGATAEDSKSSLSGQGNKTLNVYENKFAVVVTAENGTRRTYSINVVRKDADGFLGNVSRNNKLATLEVEGYDIEFDSEKLTYELFVDVIVDQLVIKASASDSKSTLNLPDSLELEVGSNELIFEVIAESGEVREYVLTVIRSKDAPILSQNQTLDLFDKLAADEIWLALSQSERVSEELLTLIKDNGKNLVLVIKHELSSYTYQYTIKNQEIDAFFKDQYELSFASKNPDRFNVLTNHAMGIVLNFAHDGVYQIPRTLKLNVSQHYEEGSVLTLYYYNEEEGKFELKQSEVIVMDGNVDIEFDSASEYFLTKSVIQTSKFDFIDDQYLIYILIGQFVLILFLFILLITKPKKKRFKPVDGK